MRSTRREILTAVLGAGAAAWGCKRSIERTWEGGDVEDGRTWGHALRGGSAEAPAANLDPSVHDVVIVGGGMAGLVAAWRLARAGVDRLVLFEAHAEVGGTSRGGANAVTAYPWGAHYVPVPGPSQPVLQALLQEVSALQPAEGRLAPAEAVRVTEPVERSYHQGRWHPGLFPFADAGARDALKQFFARVDAWLGFQDGDGRPAFSLPFATASDDRRVRALDEMTFAEWMKREGIEHPGVRWYARYACRDDYGTEPEQLSAWYGLAYFAARSEQTAADSAPFLTWPEGNARLAAHLRAAIGDRVHTGRVVQRVVPRGGTPWCRVDVRDRRGLVRSVRARSVVFAAPSYLRAFVLPEGVPAYAPRYAPWLVSNVHLRGRPEYAGFETAWDNVIVDSESLGYVVATHQRGSAHGPTVWTHYRPFSGADPRGERERMLSLSWADASEAVFVDLARAHPDLARHVERIDVLRWGHGMVRPEPGAAFDAARAAAARPFDGIHFAHTDLSGAALLEEAVHHGARAADEILRERA